jgi:hypothetical protein
LSFGKEEYIGLYEYYPFEGDSILGVKRKGINI